MAGRLGNALHRKDPLRKVGPMELTADTFKTEIAEACRSFAKYIVCLDKTPDEASETLERLVEKAIKAFANRGPTMRHGIALDRQITVILSQTELERPLCGIYFNLHSPYQKKPAPRAAKSPKAT
jgi:hypothetical protein